MNIKEFTDKVVEKIYERKGDNISIRQNEIVKVNDTVLHSINFVSPGSEMSRIFYLENYYEQYMNGKSLDDIIENIFLFLSNDNISNIDVKSVPTVMDIMNYAAVSAKIIPKVINKEKNVMYLQDKIYADFLDLAVCFCVYIDRMIDGIATTVVTKEMSAIWNVDETELMKVSINNLTEILPCRIESLISILGKSISQNDEIFTCVSENDYGMYVVLNDSKTMGASYILRSDIFREFAKKHGGCNLVIIPSSLHELIIIPEKNEAIDKEMINQMIKDVNALSVSKEDYLCNHMYRYIFDLDKVTM